MHALEQLVDANYRLRTFRDKNIVGTLPVDQRDISVKYLIMCTQILEEHALDADDFTRSFIKIFNVDPIKLARCMADEHSMVSWPVYRAFLEATREQAGMQTMSFIDRLCEKTFLNVHFFKIWIAKQFNLGYILENMGEQNHEWVTFTNVTSERQSRDRIVLRRATHRDHIQLLEDAFGREETGSMLREDCFLTAAAYEKTATRLFNDKKARIEHPQCEADGYLECVYTIRYTPIATWKLSVLKGLSRMHAIPGLQQLLAERDELLHDFFLLDSRVADASQRYRDLYERFQELHAQFLTASRHEVRNVLSSHMLVTKKSLLTEAYLYFRRLTRLADAQHDPALAGFLDAVAAELSLDSLSSANAERNQYERCRELRMEVENLLDPLTENSEERRELILDAKKGYHHLRRDYLRIRDYDLTIREAVLIDPFRGIKMYLDAVHAHQVITQSFEQLGTALRQAVEGLEISLEELVTSSFERAMQVKDKPLAFTYKLEPEVFRIPQPILFASVLRDIGLNIIDYGGGCAEVYAGAPLGDALQRFREQYQLAADCADYLRITDYGSGMPPKKIAETNAYLRGERKDIGTSDKQGNEGTRGIRKYVNNADVRKERTVVCRYSSGLQEGHGVTVEFFFVKKQ